MTPALVASDADDRAQLAHILAVSEGELNRQLGVTLAICALAFLFCWVCTLTRVFLTGRALGTFAFLPGALLMAAAAMFAGRRPRGGVVRPAHKYVLLGALTLAILDVALIQLVWAVPLLVGMAAYVFVYNNVRLNVVFGLALPVGILFAAAANAAWGMPNPDMIPYPTDVPGVVDGYVTLRAMEHPESWSRYDYFLRLLRFHTLPLCFLMMIVFVMGAAMVKRHNRRLLQILGLERQIRAIENALMTMAFGGASAAARTVPALSPEFVATIPAAEIPGLVRALRIRGQADASFAQQLLADPEAAIRRCQSAHDEIPQDSL